MFKDILIMIYKQIRKRPLRTFLTAFQITLGIAVIAVVLNLIFNLTIGIKYIETEMADNIYTLQVGSERQDGEHTYHHTRSVLTEKDMEKIKTDIDSIEYISPFDTSWSSLVHINEIYYQVNRVGFVNHDFQKITDLKIKDGMFFSEMDYKQGAEVAVIGELAANQLFPGENPLGQKIKFHKDWNNDYMSEAIDLTVIGVFEQGGVSDPYVNILAAPFFIPATLNSTNHMRPIMTEEVGASEEPIEELSTAEIAVEEHVAEPSIAPEEIIDESYDQASTDEDFTEENRDPDFTEEISDEIVYHGDIFKDDYQQTFHQLLINLSDEDYNGTKVALDNYVWGNFNDDEEAVLDKQGEMYGNVAEGMKPFLIILAIFGALTVSISSIGILTTMLVTILERTKQLGIEKALGASRSLIFWKFNLEAIIIAVFGGILGLLVAGYFSKYIEDIYETFPVMISSSLHPRAIAVSIFVAICAGFLFGMYPALQASKLEATDALRQN